MRLVLERAVNDLFNLCHSFRGGGQSASLVPHESVHGEVPGVQL